MQILNKYLVEPEWLLKQNNDNMVIIDCGQLVAYERAHIDGSVCLPIDYWLKEDNEKKIARGTHVIKGEKFVEIVNSLGVTNNATVVVYDSNGGRGASRVWWVFKYYGHNDVRVLNGGWPRWLLEKHPISMNSPKISQSSYVIKINPEMIIQFDDLINNIHGFQIVDARSRDEWTGKDLHGNPRGGRIPGAINLDWSTLISKDQKQQFLDDDELLRIIKQSGVDNNKQIVAYCQSGVRAAHVAFVLSYLGYKNVRVYDGSMFEWSRHENAPMDTGVI